MNDQEKDKKQQMQPVVMYKPHYQDNEMTLLDFWNVLVKQRNIIFYLSALFLVLAIGIALFWPRTYKAELFLLPPSAKEIEQLNIPNISSIGVGKIYHELVKNLKSRALRRQFFVENNIIDQFAPNRQPDTSVDEIFEKFNEQLIVSQQEKRGVKSEFVTLTFEGNDPQLVADFLNSYITLVDSYTVKSLVEGIETKVTMQKKILSTKIEGLRKVAENRRFDTIARFMEAEVIAEKLGIVDRTDVTSSPANSNKEVGLEIITSETPLYLRGTKELRAQITVLQKRKSDDPFIKPLRGLQEDIAQLEQIVLDVDMISSVKIDQLATPPEEPESPKRKLIVAIGLMLGIMGGILTAFILNFINQQKNEETESGDSISNKTNKTERVEG